MTICWFSQILKRIKDYPFKRWNNPTIILISVFSFSFILWYHKFTLNPLWISRFHYHFAQLSLFFKFFSGMRIRNPSNCFIFSLIFVYLVVSSVDSGCLKSDLGSHIFLNLYKPVQKFKFIINKLQSDSFALQPVLILWLALSFFL